MLVAGRLIVFSIFYNSRQFCCINYSVCITRKLNLLLPSPKGTKLLNLEMLDEDEDIYHPGSQSAPPPLTADNWDIFLQSSLYLKTSDKQAVNEFHTLYYNDDIRKNPQ